VDDKLLLQRRRGFFMLGDTTPARHLIDNVDRPVHEPARHAFSVERLADSVLAPEQRAAPVDPDFVTVRDGDPFGLGRG
jgi:hypothetical protein